MLDSSTLAARLLKLSSALALRWPSWYGVCCRSPTKLEAGRKAQDGTAPVQAAGAAGAAGTSMPNGNHPQQSQASERPAEGASDAADWQRGNQRSAFTATGARGQPPPRPAHGEYPCSLLLHQQCAHGPNHASFLNYTLLWGAWQKCLAVSMSPACLGTLFPVHYHTWTPTNLVSCIALHEPCAVHRSTLCISATGHNCVDTPWVQPALAGGGSQRGCRTNCTASQSATASPAAPHSGTRTPRTPAATAGETGVLTGTTGRRESCDWPDR
jgi:hypothetical protein